MPDLGFSPEHIDTSTPHPARMYDYYLGGMDNYEVDRDAADRVLQTAPQFRVTAHSNREFLHRAVRAAVRQGIRQIIDIGTGIPTSPNTHEVANEAAPDGDVRVAYVDNDPIVATYAGAKLTNSGNTGFVLADLRDPDAILDDPSLRELIDFDQPVALMLVAVLHFVSDEEDPGAIVAALTERLPEGSCLILTHATADFDDGTLTEQAASVYNSATANLALRGAAQVRELLKGFELVDPGLVQIPLWRPDGPVPQGQQLRQHLGYAGVGVKGGAPEGF